jgi:hypothetical protein
MAVLFIAISVRISYPACIYTYTISFMTFFKHKSNHETGCGDLRSHIFWIMGLQMAVRLSDLCAGLVLPTLEDSWYSFLLEAVSAPRAE